MIEVYPKYHSYLCSTLVGDWRSPLSRVLNCVVVWRQVHGNDGCCSSCPKSLVISPIKFNLTLSENYQNITKVFSILLKCRNYQNVLLNDREDYQNVPNIFSNSLNGGNYVNVLDITNASSFIQRHLLDECLNPIYYSHEEKLTQGIRTNIHSDFTSSGDGFHGIYALLWPWPHM